MLVVVVFKMVISNLFDAWECISSLIRVVYPTRLVSSP